MNKKTLSIITPVLALLTLILTALECFLDTGLFTVIAPLLFIATVVCGYLAFKDGTAFTSKWTWVVLVVLFSTEILNPLASFLDFGYRWSLSVLWNVSFLIGWACVFTSVLFKKLFKLMPIGFGVLALSTIATTIYNVIAHQSFSIISVMIVLIYVLLALISLGIFAKINTYLRWAAVILGLICFAASVSEYVAFSGIMVDLGYEYNLEWEFFSDLVSVIIAILLVPFKRFGFAVRKLVALLCIIATILTIITAYNAKPFAKVESIAERINEIKTKISVLEEFEKIKVEEQDFASWRLDDYYYVEFDSVLKKYVRSDVDAVLEDITEKFGDYDDYDLYENELHFYYETDYESAISSLKDDYNAEIRSARSELPEAIVNGIMSVIATLLSVAALVCLTISIYKQKYGLLAKLACLMIGIASLIYMFISIKSQAYFAYDILNYPIFVFLLSPYLWSGVVFAMFACIFSGKYQKLVKFRVLAIIAAVIAMLLGNAEFMFSETASFTMQWYAFTMICVSLLLVPCTFTEYNGIGKFIFFTIITLGIWALIWVYNVTKNLNKVASVETRKPVAELLLCMFLPFYSIYWIYKTAEAVEAYGDENGKSFKISVLCLAFTFVCPIISVILIQDKINKIVGKPA